MVEELSLIYLFSLMSALSVCCLSIKYQGFVFLFCFFSFFYVVSLCVVCAVEHISWLYYKSKANGRTNWVQTSSLRGALHHWSSFEQRYFSFLLCSTESGSSPHHTYCSVPTFKEKWLASSTEYQYTGNFSLLLMKGGAESNLGFPPYEIFT